MPKLLLSSILVTFTIACNAYSSLLMHVDNGVTGFPYVTCGSERVTLRLDTAKPFKGRVFVKGESHRKECIKSFAQFSQSVDTAPEMDNDFFQYMSRKADHSAAIAEDVNGFNGDEEIPILENDSDEQGHPKRHRYVQQSGDVLDESEGEVPPFATAPRPSHPINGETIEMSLKLGGCNMRRQRTLSPGGVEFSFTVIISFHPFFITAVDRAYQVRCFYTDIEKMVQSQLDVSSLTTHQVSERRTMPSCTYTLRRDSSSGPLVRYASIGDIIYHVWECNGDESTYSILVKNCLVDDGQGTKVQVINHQGCTNDLQLVSNVKYRPGKLAAHTKSAVFKFADKSEMNFQCSIEICIKQEENCDQVTPPMCNNKPMEEEDNWLPTGDYSLLENYKRNPQSTTSGDQELTPYTEDTDTLNYGKMYRQRDLPIGTNGNVEQVAAVNKTRGSNELSEVSNRTVKAGKLAKRETTLSSGPKPKSRSYETDISADSLIIVPFKDDLTKRNDDKEYSRLTSNKCDSSTYDRFIKIGSVVVIAVSTAAFASTVLMATLFFKSVKYRKFNIAH